MRLVTRSDFDGLACGALLKEAGIIDSWKCFMIYSMYPEQNISAWIVSGRGGAGCSAAVGYSILNRTSNVNVGSLMLKYNGGGHKAVGTCQFSDENMETELPKMLKELCELANA